MTDEEMAYKHAEEYVEHWIVGEDDNALMQEAYKDGFLDGLKESRKQWHDLRKNPKDLPKHTNSVLGYCRGDYYDVCFFNGKRLIGHGESDFLKWKEIE